MPRQQILTPPENQEDQFLQQKAMEAAGAYFGGGVGGAAGAEAGRQIGGTVNQMSGPGPQQGPVQAPQTQVAQQTVTSPVARRMEALKDADKFQAGLAAIQNDPAQLKMYGPMLEDARNRALRIGRA